MSDNDSDNDKVLIIMPIKYLISILVLSSLVQVNIAQLQAKVTHYYGTLSKDAVASESCPSHANTGAPLDEKALQQGLSDWDKYPNIHQAIADYLTNNNPNLLKNALKDVLKSRVSDNVQVLVVDVTGDNVPEVILNLIFSQTNDGYLFIFRCENGRYTGEPIDEGGAGGAEPPPIIEPIQDINNDGLPEIIYFFIPNVGNDGNSPGCVKIWSWNGQQFANIAPLDLSKDYDDPLCKSTIQGRENLAIRPHGDGTYEIALRQWAMQSTRYGGSIAERDEEIIWAWNGKVFARFCQRAVEPAVYRIQAALDGDNEMMCHNYEKSLHAYQRVIFGTDLLGWDDANSIYDVPPPTATPDPNERPLMNAYARYRIMLLHVVQHEMQEAQMDYAIIKKLFPPGQIGNNVTKLADVFWDSFSSTNNAAAACQKVIAYAFTHDEVLEPFHRYIFESGGGSRRPVFGFVEDVRQICPLTG